MSMACGISGMPRLLLDARQFFERQHEFAGCELVHGEVISMTPTGWEHGRIEVRLARLLDEHLEAQGQGAVVGGEVGYQLSAETVRAADVAVHLQIPPPGVGFLTQLPELVVEVLSPGEAWPDVEQKVAEWLAAGVREVWLVNPKHRTVTQRRDDGSSLRLELPASLETALLPGLSIPLARLFG